MGSTVSTSRFPCCVLSYLSWNTAGCIVGKKWEPRNPVPGPFSAKIRKVNQNSESSKKFGKLIRKIWKKLGKFSKIRKVRPENSERSAKFGKFMRKIRKKFGKLNRIRKVRLENSES